VTKGAVIVAHHERAEAAALGLSASKWLADHGFTVWMPPEDAAALDVDDLADARPPGEADLAISLGGDGTMLRAMRLADGQRAPVLGVNLGKLGFLAEVDVPDLPGALSAIDENKFTVEPRMAVDAGNGTTDRIQLDLRGSSLNATIDAGDQRAAHTMAAHKSELVHTLTRDGLNIESLEIRATTVAAPVATESAHRSSDSSSHSRSERGAQWQQQQHRQRSENERRQHQRDERGGKK
jgi:NAD kinase